MPELHHTLINLLPSVVVALGRLCAHRLAFDTFINRVVTGAAMQRTAVLTLIFEHAFRRILLDVIVAAPVLPVHLLVHLTRIEAAIGTLRRAVHAHLVRALAGALR